MAGTVRAASGFAADQITTCFANDWTAGHACANLASALPSAATKVKLYFNADTLTPRSVIYGGTETVTIAAGAMFPIYS